MSRIKWPSVTEVALRLNDVRKKLLRPYFTEEMDRWVTIRLEIREDGYWRLHIDDPQCSDNHTSFWGCDDVSLKCNCLEVAASLLREAQDHAYIHGVK